jgi:serine/threonine protein kinase
VVSSSTVTSSGDGAVIDGRYRLGREIARGGMSVVYFAEHLFTGRTVALKLLQAHLLRDQDCRARLLREARALAMSRHPNVVEILDAGVTPNDELYVVLEMLDGRGLDGILTTRGSLSVGEAVYLGIKLCESLEYAHAHGVVHRDVKPSNVYVVRSDAGREAYKLIDFGIVAIDGVTTSETDEKLTKRGTLLGTPEYMAPERLLLKENVDHRSDLYSVAVTIYECLTGEVPFPGPYSEVLLAATTQLPLDVRLKRPQVPDAVAEVVARGLARDPADRFQSAQAFARALAKSSENLPRYTQLLGPAKEIDLGADEIDVLDGGGIKPPPVPVRRRHIRAPYVTPVRIVRADGEVIEGRSEDISEGGLLVMTPLPAGETGGKVTVYFAPPAMSRAIAVQAMARWVRDGRGGIAAGMEFINIADEVRVAIAQYVKVLQGVMASA